MNLEPSPEFDALRRALGKLEEAARGDHSEAAAMAGMMRWQGEVSGSLERQPSPATKIPLHAVAHLSSIFLL